ncbi:MAG: hypothetical protein LQ338_004846 [Usnochroma carphineum]|nr:MAG: hypothetical protein LQ338_004846 [Usnochroma carphineum]
MLIQNFCRQYNTDVQRIRDELEALEDGASDDIFQTRASLYEEQLPLNIAISLDESAGVAAGVSLMKHRLHFLLPIEQPVRPATYIPPQLMNDIVEHFRRVVMDFPLDEHPMDSMRRENGKVHGFIDNFWNGKGCHFPDTLLRQLRPHAPERWDLDCWIAKCFIRQVICREHGVHYADIKQDREKRSYRFRNPKDSVEEPLAAMAMMLIGSYVSKLSVRLAAWMPYELIVVQAQEDVRVHSAFISGVDYYPKLVFPNSGEFPDADFHMCLGHVLDWLEARNWHDPLLRFSKEEYREMFWDAIDEGTEEWRHTAAPW